VDNILCGEESPDKLVHPPVIPIPPFPTSSWPDRKPDMTPSADRFATTRKHKIALADHVTTLNPKRIRNEEGKKDTQA